MIHTLKGHNHSIVILALLILMAQTTEWGRSIYITHVADPIWIRTEVEIIPQAMGQPPKIEYSKETDRPVRAVWTAIVRGHDHTRLSTRRGDGNYFTSAGEASPIWSWDAFFDDGIRNAPRVPMEPFMVCVWYRASDLRVDLTRDTPEYCSSVFDPRVNRLVGSTENPIKTQALKEGLLP
jgi:hypothetical protein